MKLKKIILWAAFVLAVTIIVNEVFFLNNPARKKEKLQSVPASLGNASFVLGPGEHSFSLTHNGLNRKYIAHVPGSYDSKMGVPLVIAMHGGLGSATSSPDYFELNPKADKEGFIVVYPEGTGIDLLGKHFGSWNAGRCCNPAMNNRVDDVGFIDKMIDKLSSDFNINAKMIYATGFSNGGMMSFRLACELSDKIAAVAPSGSAGNFDACQPLRKVPILYIQGKQDPCSPYEGGICGGCANEYISKLGIPVKNTGKWDCLSIPEYIKGWAERNGCSDNIKITYQNGGAQCATYQECDEHSDITSCVIDEHGHTWAGKKTYGTDACNNFPNSKACTIWKKGVGPLSQDLIANDQIWKFFKTHPLQ
jgi:polyhydroxybutyrate depolymerase